MLVRNILVLGIVVFCSNNIWSEQILEINSQLPVDGIGKTVISGFSFQNKEVTYEKIDDLAIVEGDIVLGTVAEVAAWPAVKNNKAVPHGLQQSIIRSGDRYRWINNLVPFQFSSNVSSDVRRMMLDAMEHWEINTPIRFIWRDSDNADYFPDFVNIISDQHACWSYVGRKGGQQNLNIVAACGFGSAVHEFGHVIGLWHEQSREDRDNYVEIHWENIEDGRAHNFNQHINDGDDMGEYDYQSIMHYGSFAFSGNGLRTITALQSALIGQRDGLSRLDIASVNKNYPAFIPVADIVKSDYYVFLGSSVLFDGRQSFDPNGGKLSFFWDFGDGNSRDNEAAVSHIYTDTGKYTVSLIVEDNEGISDIDTAEVVVYGVEVLLVPIISSVLK